MVNQVNTPANDPLYNPRNESFEVSSFKQFPRDLMRLIFSHLGVQDQKTASLVCRNFAAIAQDMKIWAALARQLHITLRNDDTIDLIKSLLLLREKIKNIHEANYEFREGEIILKEEDPKGVVEKLRKELSQFEENGKGLDHPYFKKLKKEIEHLECHKHPQEQLAVFAVLCALENQSEGTFCLFTASTNTHLVYKSSDINVYAFSTQRPHQIGAIFGHMLKKQVPLKGKVIRSTPSQAISYPSVSLEGKELKNYAQNVMNQFRNIPPHSSEQRLFRLPAEEGRVHIIEIEPDKKRVILTKESKTSIFPRSKVPLNAVQGRHENVYRAVLEGSKAADFLKHWKNTIR